ncbi:MAG: cupredoxin domain-containing protein [Chloroflexi bacterium]|nr:cupredoxin domain-containing protein [Chloroflexota bacterium]
MSKKQWFFGFLVVLAGAVIVFAPLLVRAVPPTRRTFRVEASQFAYLPAVLQVNPGDLVTIELVSMDVVHGLYLDGYGVSVTADPGQTAHLTFTADRSGSFRFRCNVTCGALHPFMIGKLQVGPNLWLWRAIALTALAMLAILILHPSLPKAQAS